jgi:HEPN domain-containing protein
MAEQDELVAQWLAKAADDLEAAERSLAGKPLCWVAAFHAQQAAEKVLKAFLTRHRVEYERSHNIDYLLDLCVAIEPQMEALRASANRLTDYAVELRYPFPHPEPTLSDAREAVEIAESVRDLVQRLPGMPTGQDKPEG